MTILVNKKTSKIQYVVCYKNYHKDIIIVKNACIEGNEIEPCGDSKELKISKTKNRFMSLEL